MFTNHEDHECKEVHAKLSNFMELMKHVEKLQNKELEQGDDCVKEKFRAENRDLKKDKEVDFTDSTLDEFNLENNLPNK